MKIQMISGTLMLLVALTSTLILGSCGNSGNSKTESTNQEVAEKGSSTATETVAENTTATPASAPTLPEETDATKTPGTTKANAQTVKTEPAKSTATPAPSQSNPVVNPAIATSPKEEIKVTPQPQPVSKPAPVAEKAKEMTVVPPAKDNTKVVEQQPEPENWVVPAKDKNKSNPVKADAESLSIGKSLYVKHCTSCHGKSGRGDGSKAAQLETKCGNFTLPAFQKQPDGALFYKIREGKGDMPSFKKKIPDEEDIWSIVQYIRTL